MPSGAGTHCAAGLIDGLVRCDLQASQRAPAEWRRVPLRLRAGVGGLTAARRCDELGHLHDHFTDARLEFFSADALRSFSRDSLPPGEFERLQEQVRYGVIDVVRAAHDDGYGRVLAVVGAAKQLPLDAHPLNTRIDPLDRGGICHQLVNDRRFLWLA